MTLNNLTKLERIYPLFIKKFEDFNPLPENKSITDKVNSMILYLNSVGKLTNEVVNDWNKVMQWVMNDGLQESIYAKVDKLISENKLNELIDPIINEITQLAEEQITLIVNNQVVTKTDLENVNEQLATKLSIINFDAYTTYLEARINALTSQWGKTFQTYDELDEELKEDDKKLHIVTADDNWYFWLEGFGWTSGGEVNTVLLADGSITIEKLSQEMQENWNNLMSTMTEENAEWVI